MKYLKKFENVFDNISQLEIGDFKDVYDGLMNSVKKKKSDVFIIEVANEFDVKFDDDFNNKIEIVFPTIELVNFDSHQFTLHGWKYIMQKDIPGEIAIQYKSTGSGTTNDELSANKIENIKNVEDAIKKLTPTFKRIHYSYLTYNKGKYNLKLGQHTYKNVWMLSKMK